MKRTFLRASTGLFGLVLLASTAFASPNEATLGSGGELYTVRTGTYGELVPDGTETARDNSVLVLEILRPQTGAERLLVPSTRGGEVESSASLVFEEDSGTVFLVWASQINSIHSVINLVSFNGQTWSRPIQVIGNPYSPKTIPQVAITYDSYRDTRANAANSEPATKHRTVLHLIWGEDNQGGLLDTLYSPIILENGNYIGDTPVFVLNHFDQTDGQATSFETSPALLSSPTIQKGRDGRTVVVAFASAATRRLTTLEIDVLPQELIRLGDGARAQIIDLGDRLAYTPNNAPSFANQIRARIIEAGGAFHPEVAQSIADRVHGLLLTGTGRGLSSAADAARAQIIDLGAKLSVRGLRTPPVAPNPLAASAAAAAATTGRIEEIRGEEEGASAHLLQFRVASRRAAPRVGEGRPLSIFLSDSGQSVLIAWPEDQSIFYRESRGDGWNDIRELRTSAALPVERAYEILRQRVENQ